MGLAGYQPGAGCLGQPRAHGQGPRAGRDVPDLAALRTRRPVAGCRRRGQRRPCARSVDLSPTRHGHPSQSGRRDHAFGTYVGTFTASARTEVLSLVGCGSAGHRSIDDLVVIGVDPGVWRTSRPLRVRGGHRHLGGQHRHRLLGRGGDPDRHRRVVRRTVSSAAALDLPGGTNANAVDLPDNLLQDAADFTTSFWVRPDAKAELDRPVPHRRRSRRRRAASSRSRCRPRRSGNTGLAATFKRKGSHDLQERVYATPTKDVAANQWNHVAFTRQGATGTLYLERCPRSRARTTSPST